jgi:ABC-type Fe3+/spermidine/putrescine transport system ATPase subunit
MMQLSVIFLKNELLETSRTSSLFNERLLELCAKTRALKHGNIMQTGTPEEIYKKPQNAFVAGFIGKSNFLDGVVVSQKEDLTASIQLKSGALFEIILKKQYTGKVTVSIRPEATLLAQCVAFKTSVLSGGSLPSNGEADGLKMSFPGGLR